VGLEQVGRIDTAFKGYDTALGRWPENLLAHIGRGNSAYAKGEYAVAESAYRDALQIEPEKAEAWNNLAYALAQLGRHEASIDAINRALTLDPDNQNFQDSLTELTNWQ
ncbi:MAG: tetratricopeptide repeat protein, partial [Gammaproteobacteria bacterium]|nr:tetratricopeptide repeat protein [Gammaproteobacteria bacterium]